MLVHRIKISLTLLLIFFGKAGVCDVQPDFLYMDKYSLPESSEMTLLLEESAKDDPNASFKLGVHHLNRKGERSEALKYLKRSALLGNPQANILLGLMYYRGEGVIKDKEQAKRYMIEASRKDRKFSHHNLGVILWHENNVKAAVSKLEIAAEEGLSVSQHLLGGFYLKGEKVEKDISKSIYYLKKASDNKQSRASYLLGMIYLKEQYSNVNKKLAEKYFKTAAELGHVRGMYNLATMYFYGEGIAVNKDMAKYWYRKAANNGHDKSREKLANFENAVE